MIATGTTFPASSNRGIFWILPIAPIATIGEAMTGDA